MPHLPFGELRRRLTSIGITTPFGGFSVTFAPSSEPDRQRAAQLLAFLEDRRVLFDPWDVEIPQHCVDSVMQIRSWLARNLAQAERQGPLAASLRGMLSACHHFLTRINHLDLARVGRFGSEHVPGMIFFQALGELRGQFGIHVAQLAATYGLDINGELTTIIPDPNPQ